MDKENEYINQQIDLKCVSLVAASKYHFEKIMHKKEIRFSVF